MKGQIIVIEGTDGSGKQTQSLKLLQYLIMDKKKKVLRQSFPNYESDSSAPVKMYLNGDFGDANSLDAYQASALFAVDRLCSMQKLKRFVEEGGTLILDRYTESNMMHQAGKIHDLKERDSFLEWLDEFEFGELKLPRPDKVIFLDVPVEISERLAKERGKLKTGGSKDVHEADKEHLKNAYEAGKYVANKFGWDVIGCTNERNEILSIDEIFEKIKKVLEI